MRSKTVVPDGSVVGVYNDREAAQEIQQAISSVGVSAQNVVIDDHITPKAQLDAMGTIVGGEAGLLLGAFYGGVIGLVVAIILPNLVDSVTPNSAFNRLLIVASALAGALVCWAYGKRNYAKQSKDQKQKGDPYMPRTFRVVVRGSEQEINKAKEAVRNIEIYHESPAA